MNVGILATCRTQYTRDRSIYIFLFNRTTLQVFVTYLHVREFLNQYLPQRWIRRGTDDDQILLAWPPCSPDATPCDFFLWGYVKDKVYVPPPPTSIPELKVQIRTAMETITADMLQTV